MQHVLRKNVNTVPAKLVCDILKEKKSNTVHLNYNNHVISQNNCTRDAWHTPNLQTIQA